MEFIRNWHVHIDKSTSRTVYKNLKEHNLPEFYINVMNLFKTISSGFFKKKNMY